MALLGFDKTMGVSLKGKVGAKLLLFLVKGDYYNKKKNEEKLISKQ